MFIILHIFNNLKLGKIYLLGSNITMIIKFLLVIKFKIIIVFFIYLLFKFFFTYVLPTYIMLLKYVFKILYSITLGTYTLNFFLI